LGRTPPVDHRHLDAALDRLAPRRARERDRFLGRQAGVHEQARNGLPGRPEATTAGDHDALTRTDPAPQVVEHRSVSLSGDRYVHVDDREVDELDLAHREDVGVALDSIGDELVVLDELDIDVRSVDVTEAVDVGIEVAGRGGGAIPVGCPDEDADLGPRAPRSRT
jgi:hypothetical protein